MSPNSPFHDELSGGETLRGLAPGQRVFNRYELIRILGRGGMGVVWLARDLDLQREVALKFLPEMFAYNRGAIEDLKRETRRALDLSHPNIVRIHDFRQDGVTAAISMEYVDGDTLGNLRADRPQGCFGVEDIRGWTRQLCAALSYAHEEARVVHRDLKPANLMVTSRGTLKVADFGVSHSLNASVTQLTRAGGVSGTLAYMSPQQLRGEEPVASDDIYALGATLFELLTGRPPFTSGDLGYQIREVQAPGVNARRAALALDQVPSEWDQVIAACLAKRPEQRPQSILEAGQKLGLDSDRSFVPLLVQAKPSGTMPSLVTEDPAEIEAVALPTPEPLISENALLEIVSGEAAPGCEFWDKSATRAPSVVPHRDPQRKRLALAASLIAIIFFGIVLIGICLQRG